jgi:hypothetical protein
MMALIEEDGWPIDVYRKACVTLGRDVEWEPDGRGRAVDVAPDGALIVEGDAGTETVYSGVVRHVRDR